MGRGHARQALVLASGALLAVFNNIQGSLRFPLTVALSDDGGATWPYARDLEVKELGIPVKSQGDYW